MDEDDGIGVADAELRGATMRFKLFSLEQPYDDD